MEELATNGNEKKEQTLIGKILGWFFGIMFCMAIFTVGDQEIGAAGFWIAVIGVLLLPPVNMPLRRKYQNFTKNRYGEKYGTFIINLGYAAVKTLFIIVLLFIIAGVSSTNKETPADASKEQLKTVSAKIQTEKPSKPKISYEYKNALIKAENYSATMHMSKKAIYDQLTSEYGEQFPADAAQYAIDNMNADFQMNALAKAKSYQEGMNMSKKAIYDQLISQYGEKFTVKEAQYAIDHLND